MAALDLKIISLSNRANEEIAQVRAKANTEAVALNAGLRKEQMKVESLERAVLQKVGGCLNVLEFVFIICHHHLFVPRRIKRSKSSRRSAMS